MVKLLNASLSMVIHSLKNKDRVKNMNSQPTIQMKVQNLKNEYCSKSRTMQNLVFTSIPSLTVFSSTSQEMIIPQSLTSFLSFFLSMNLFKWMKELHSRCPRLVLQTLANYCFLLFPQYDDRNGDIIKWNHSLLTAS